MTWWRQFFMSAGKKLAQRVGLAIDIHFSLGSRPPTSKATDTRTIIFIIFKEDGSFSNVNGQLLQFDLDSSWTRYFSIQDRGALKFAIFNIKPFHFYCKIELVRSSFIRSCKLAFSFLFLLFYKLICSFAKPFSFLSCLFRARKICFDTLMR